LCLLGRNSTTWKVHPQSLFSLDIFQIGSCVFFSRGLLQTTILRTVVSLVAWITGAHHCLVYWLRWGLANFLPRLASNYNPPNLYLLNTGIIDMNLYIWQCAYYILCFNCLLVHVKQATNIINWYYQPSWFLNKDKNYF
jgi:hypothetical protein